jgi:cathepsin A (carboxypeptidase C)
VPSLRHHPDTHLDTTQQARCTTRLAIMKVASLIPLLGAASAAVAPAQKPLGFNLPDPSDFSPSEAKSKPWLHPVDELKKALGSLTEDARKTWDEVALMFPDSFNAENLFSKPKAHTRKASNEWDHVMKGSELQNVWVTNAKGEKERALDGHLSPYSLRTKKVDPSTLGVDTVKQYSGYLDDEEEDKHLFYCMCHACGDARNRETEEPRLPMLTVCSRVLRITQ